MSQSNVKTQIGDLLVGAGLVTAENISAALSMSRGRMPLGRVLIDNGLLSDLELNGALQAQNLIREKFISTERALEILAAIRTSGESFLVNLYAGGCDIEHINFSRGLGKLFQDAGIVDADQLHTAMETSVLSGLPIVRVLVLQRLVTEMVAYAGLTAQLLLREKKIGYDQAVGSLKLSHMHGEQIEEILEFGGFKRYRPEGSVRLGELLVLSDLIQEIDLLSCVEKSMGEAKPLGQILVDDGIMDELLLASALRAQSYIQTGQLEPLRAAGMLRQCARSGQPLEFSVADMAAIKPVMMRPHANGIDPHKFGLVDLLEMLGLAFSAEVDQMRLIELEEGQAGPEILQEYIAKLDYLDRDLLTAIQQGLDYVRDGIVTPEQLTFVMHVWLWRRGPLADTMSMLGYKL
jgi:hypothetical protein